jgi:hypothetical protein
MSGPIFVTGREGSRVSDMGMLLAVPLYPMGEWEDGRGDKVLGCISWGRGDDSAEGEGGGR